MVAAPSAWAITFASPSRSSGCSDGGWTGAPTGGSNGWFEEPAHAARARASAVLIWWEVVQGERRCNPPCSLAADVVAQRKRLRDRADRRDAKTGDDPRSPPASGSGSCAQNALRTRC